MDKITKLKQIENYPTGDCMRSVIACLMSKECVTEVPNFMRDGESKFDEYMLKWLEENNLEWIEVDYESWLKSFYMPVGFCGITGKSPRGEYDHIVVGEIKKRQEEDKIFRDIYFIHDTSPFADGSFIDGGIKYIGFLVRKL